MARCMPSRYWCLNGGTSMMKALIAFCLGLSTALCAQQKSPSPLMPPLEAQASTRPNQFENQYLKIQILPGWTVAPSTDQTLNLIEGKYLRSINPIFLHASGIIGWSFGVSIDAAVADLDQPAGRFRFAQSVREQLR